MKESTKELLGIQPADLIIYSAFLFIVPVYYSNNKIIDISCIIIGLIICFISCWVGMKPNKELNKTNNFLKKLAYPACTILFLYLAYLNFTSWQ